MLFELHAAIYKNRKFWCYGDLYLETDSPELAKQYRFNRRHDLYPDVYLKRVHRWQLQKMFYVHRTVEYKGYRFGVHGYSRKENAYLLSTEDLTMVERLGFERTDKFMCDKLVLVSETLNPVDEYEVIYKRPF